MAKHDMTYRVVPLRGEEARDAQLGSSAAQRLEMVRELSRAAWTAGGRGFPCYDRANIPLRRSTLGNQGTTADR